MSKNIPKKIFIIIAAFILTPIILYMAFVAFVWMSIFLESNSLKKDVTGMLGSLKTQAVLRLEADCTIASSDCPSVYTKADINLATEQEVNEKLTGLQAKYSQGSGYIVNNYECKSGTEGYFCRANVTNQKNDNKLAVVISTKNISIFAVR